MRRCNLSLLVLAAFSFSRLRRAGSSTVVNGSTVAGGLFHTCMIVADLSLRCFGGGSSDLVGTLAPTGSVENGFGNFGQIGSGDNETLGDEEGEMGGSLDPVDLGNSTVQDVAAGQSHTCVVLTSGDVACFGYNYYGQLGMGDQTSRGRSTLDMGDNLDLVDLGTGRTATRIGCGQHHTCAVLDDGSLKCWGYNNNGMLGLGDTTNRGDGADELGDDLPTVDLGTGRTAVSVAGGRYHTCALLDNATLKCWGGSNSTDHNNGQLGQGNTYDLGTSEGQMGDALPAIDLGTNRTVVAFAPGWVHTCALLDDATLKCFGRNFDGQLGLGDTEDRGDEPGEMGDDLPAVDLGTDRYAVAVACGRWHTCVLLDNNDVKCFGVNTSDDLGAGQLGLEDMENRGRTLNTTGDGLDAVQLGTGRTSGWVFVAFDHTCVIFDDSTVKCWGLNASGQLGLGHTDDVGAEEDSMGDYLTAVQPGMRLALPPSPVVFDEDSIAKDTAPTASAESSEGSSTAWSTFLAAGGGVLGLAVFCTVLLCLRARRKRQAVSRLGDSSAPSTFDLPRPKPAQSFPESQEWLRYNNAVPVDAHANTKGARDRISPAPQTNTRGKIVERMIASSIPSGATAAAATTAMVVAGGVVYGWEVVSQVAETLPWIGAAFLLLNDLVDVVETKFELEGNFGKIRSWAHCLRDVILQICRQIEMRPGDKSQTLKFMSMDVVSNLEDLVATVTEWEKKGMLAQYLASRSCKSAVEDADTALRGALQRLTVGQTAELMTMVSGLQASGLVVTERLGMVFEQLRRQEETTARMELRLAEYGEAMAEVLGHLMRGKEKEAPSGKTLRELGTEAMDQLQIPSEDLSYPSKMPFAAGTFSEVYQVVHEGVVKVAKKTNLRRLGLRPEDTNRVFGRFVKELYILSRLRSERVVSVYGAVATQTELTLVMEFVERGSLRSILDDDAQREQMTPTVKHGLLADTAEGMSYLYGAGVEHRDLKSANCLVTHDWRVKITDFGLSNTTDAISTGSASSVGSFRGGTLNYAAPELLVAGSTVIREVPAELSDVYSFGVIAWDVMCGNGDVPWARVSTATLSMKLRRGERLYIPANCSDFYRTMMTDCWDKDPHRRPRFERLKVALKRRVIEEEEKPPPATLPRRALVEAMRPSNPAAYHSSRGRRDAQSRLYGRQPDILRHSSEQNLAPLPMRTP